MHAPVPLKKLVVELRYKPNLAFYGKMDGVALHFNNKFPHWERTPLTVEIRNRELHKRVLFANQRSVFEVDLTNQEPSVEFDSATAVLKYAAEGFTSGELERVGVRQWFAVDLGKTFALMVDEFDELFLSRQRELKSILSDTPFDLAYVVDFETQEGWKYHLRLGPMTKEEWIQTVPYDRNIFESSKDKKPASFEMYCETLPLNCMFVDIDCYAEKIRVTQLASKIATFRRRSHEVVSSLIAYCKKKSS